MLTKRWQLLALLVLVIIGLGARPTTIAAKIGSEAVLIQFQLEASGFGSITGLVFTDDGRLFVVEQQGVVRVIQADGTLLPTAFLDIRDQVSSGSERGLLGMALHPAYAVNGTFFVNYTGIDGATNIVSYQTSSVDENRADPSSKKLLLAIGQPFANHNGGDLAFGHDGKLYISVGDGGGGGDPQDNAQNGQTLLGKILRIDVDNPDQGKEYGIPADNPFVDDPEVKDEIWATGLRNPWRISFDRVTGDLFIADVGQWTWEEINVESAGGLGGLNYGWRCYEGYAPFNLVGCADALQYQYPVFAWGRQESCAIIGGYVYRGLLYKAIIDGHYLFADLCSGRVRGLLADGQSNWRIASVGRTPVRSITTFGQGPQGELYIAGSGTIYRISAVTESLQWRLHLPFVALQDG